jgi:hypothetical protein
VDFECKEISIVEKRASQLSGVNVLELFSSSPDVLNNTAWVFVPGDFYSDIVACKVARVNTTLYIKPILKYTR